MVVAPRAGTDPAVLRWPALTPSHPPPPTPKQVLPTQLVPDEEEGKILRVRLIMKVR